MLPRKAPSKSGRSRWPMAGMPCVFNRGDAAAKVTAKWSDMGVTGSHKVRDLWKHEDLGKVADQYSVEVPSHGVVMIKIAK